MTSSQNSVKTYFRPKKENIMTSAPSEILEKRFVKLKERRRNLFVQLLCNRSSSYMRRLGESLEHATILKI